MVPKPPKNKIVERHSDNDPGNNGGCEPVRATDDDKQTPAQQHRLMRRQADGYRHQRTQLLNDSRFTQTHSLTHSHTHTETDIPPPLHTHLIHQQNAPPTGVLYIGGFIIHGTAARPGQHKASLLRRRQRRAGIHRSRPGHLQQQKQSHPSTTHTPFQSSNPQPHSLRNKLAKKVACFTSPTGKSAHGNRLL